MAVEFRHSSWFDDEQYGILRDRNAALCVADTEAGTTPVVVTADFGYLRLRDRPYKPAELTRWARTAPREEWRDAFVYFKHEESGAGPTLARALVASCARFRGLIATAVAVPAGRRSARLRGGPAT